MVHFLCVTLALFINVLIIIIIIIIIIVQLFELAVLRKTFIQLMLGFINLILRYTRLFHWCAVVHTTMLQQ